MSLPDGVRRRSVSWCGAALVMGLLSVCGAGKNTSTDFITVRNSKTLGIDEIPCERIALGQPDDYKPCVARLPDGELLVAAFHQHRFGPRKIREDLLTFRSNDGGLTWSKRHARSDVLGREYYLTALKDGTLLMTVHLISYDVRNPDDYTHSYVHRSDDGGRTWNTTRVEPDRFPPKTVGVTTRNVLELSDGSLLMGVSGYTESTYLMWRSTDGGRTWPQQYQANVAGLPQGHKSSFFGETVLWQARSGKIYAIDRVNSHVYPPLPGRNRVKDQTDHSSRLILYASTDLGHHWKKVRDIGGYSMMYPSILRLQDGRLLLTYTQRGGEPPIGVRAVVGKESEDGFRFDFDHDLILLDTKTPAGKLSGGGFGPTVQIDDGTLITSISYRDANDKTHLEVVRWRLPAK